MKKTDYLLLGLFLAVMIAALMALRIVPCAPMKGSTAVTFDGIKPSACQGFGGVEF